MILSVNFKLNEQIVFDARKIFVYLCSNKMFEMNFKRRATQQARQQYTK